MRVISGKLSGQIFASPSGHRTHPMSEKIRGAIFGALGDISDLTLLDAFSGSGAIAIEAVSRGAKHVTAIEVDKKAHSVIQDNIVKLGIRDRIKVIRAFAGAWSIRHQSAFFDVIILDPPFDKIPYRDLDRMPRHLKPEGVLVLSWPNKVEDYRFRDLEIIHSKVYGDAKLNFYKSKTK